MDDSRFPRLVSLACHDLRTPLATIYGFARTLTRMEEHDERTGRYLGMIEEAAEQMTELLDELGAAARIEAGRWEPALREVDTLELARSTTNGSPSRGRERRSRRTRRRSRRRCGRWRSPRSATGRSSRCDGTSPAASWSSHR